MKQTEIWLINLDPTIGSEINKTRPGIIINDDNLGKDWEGGFFCACHGSKFDLAGKVSNGSPAGANLKVPPYRFEDENTIIVGELPADNEESKV